MTGWNVLKEHSVSGNGTLRVARNKKLGVGSKQPTLLGGPDWANIAMNMIAITRSKDATRSKGHFY